MFGPPRILISYDLILPINNGNFCTFLHVFRDVEIRFYDHSSCIFSLNKSFVGLVFKIKSQVSTSKGTLCHQSDRYGRFLKYHPNTVAGPTHTYSITACYTTHVFRRDILQTCTVHLVMSHATMLCSRVFKMAKF